jgi:hypothetical protein
MIISSLMNATAGLAIQLRLEPAQNHFRHYPPTAGHIPLCAHSPLEDGAEGALIW